MLAGLQGPRRAALLEAMGTIRRALSAERAPEVSLRAHRPGDMGWVIERHGALYFQEYGWNEEFEALVAGITADFIHKLDPARERCWIAESQGRRLGCVFLVAGAGATARLRLLLVEPEARGLGLGRRLRGLSHQGLALRGRGGLRAHHALDPRESAPRAAPLHPGGISQNCAPTPSQLRAHAHLRDLAARAACARTRRATRCPPRAASRLGCHLAPC